MKNMRIPLWIMALCLALQPLGSFAAEKALPANAAGSIQNVAGFEQARLSAKEQALLRRNGFVIQPTHLKDFVDIYDSAEHLGQGQFITTDALLHTSHIFFDYLLRLLEIEKLSGMVQSLTNHMLAASTQQYREARDPDLKEAARLNIGFFAVAKDQFTPNYAPGHGLAKLVRKELANIDKHEGFKFRALLPYVPNPSLFRTPYAYEDYSQYVPRGHYTRNEQFKQYFKAMMWYGRIDFKLLLKRGKPSKVGRMMTLQALLMTEALTRDPEAMRLWRQIYEPTVYFVGKSDDLDVFDYAALMKKIFPGTALKRLADKTRLDAFILQAQKLRNPGILSGAGTTASGNKGFRLMGQRYIPDSYIFQELVYGAAGPGPMPPSFAYTGKGHPFTMVFIPEKGPTRAFPRGLDVMAVLGSARALDLLRREGDTDYTDYAAQFSMLSKKFAATTNAEWQQNLYWRWLYALLPLLDQQKTGGPQPFLNSAAWADKELQTSLGSWTELRHDTILYAKQSYTGISKSIALPPPPADGYVEPAPAVYGRLAALFRDVPAKLGNLASIDGIDQKLAEFAKVLNRLKEISAKELAARPLSAEDYDFISEFHGMLRSLTRFSPQVMKRIASGTDTRIDVIADVHTESNTRTVLEEAVGSPADIYVLVRDDRGTRLCRGGVFTYYEFKQPMSNRLTDEQWQQMANRPARPAWAQAMGN